MSTSRAPLPLPVRLAAGIVASAAEQAKWLPSRVIGLPVTVISHTLQLSMRLQQQVTALAIKGDDALAGLRPVQETPSWATFDEDLPGTGDAGEATPAGANAMSDQFAAQGTGTAGSAMRVLPEEHTAPVIGTIGLANEQHQGTSHPAGSDRATSEDGTGHGRPQHGDGAAAVAADTADEDPWSVESKELTREHVDGEGDSDAADSPPACFPNYAELSLPQLRARLRRFSLADLHELLDHERSHAARPDFVKMLARRIDTVRAEQ